ncbi:hypothetical protein RHS01_08352 [Rhizoctonia solani]|uniref:Uncharacterized protein n=1 Tax=Rhizoctonia solani TaxID=456999 RepID=A0A8H7M256_9AGAM|nr:hypothetical protein RHS01_08352 [Rhizoctonia solani]
MGSPLDGSGQNETRLVDPIGLTFDRGVALLPRRGLGVFRGPGPVELEASKPILDNINGLGYVFNVGAGLDPCFLDFPNLLFEAFDLAEEAKEETGDALEGYFPSSTGVADGRKGPRSP